jgi:hypothetical protein
MRKSDVKDVDTFIITVDHHQNETWQGKIVWGDEHRSERFRSMIEMLRLMEQVRVKSAKASDSEKGIV